MESKIRVARVRAKSYVERASAQREASYAKSVYDQTVGYRVHFES